MVTIVLDSGTRVVRGVQRDCKLLVTRERNETPVVRLGVDLPQLEELPIFPILYTGFRWMMREYGLDWRRRRYQTEEERKEGLRQALIRYRSSPRFLARRLLRTQLHQLTEEQIKLLNDPTQDPLRLARRWRMSLRDVQEQRAAQEVHRDSES